MEHLGEILKRMQTQTNTSGESTGTWSSDDTNTEPAGDKNCPICHGGGFVHPRQSSGAPDFTRVVPCRCVKAAKQKEQENRLLKFSNLGALVRLNFNNLQPQGRSGSPVNQQQFAAAYEAAKVFAAKPEGWLVLVGPSGSGKTHLAAAIANEAIAHDMAVYFQNVPDLLDHLRSAFAPGSEIPYDELFDKICNVSLLIMDDLGIQAGTPWAKEKMDQILNHRFTHELPTVVTTSVSINKLDERIYTRINSRGLSRIYYLEGEIQELSQYSWPKGSDLLQGMTFKSFDYKRLNLPPDQRQNLEATYQVAMQYADSPDGWLVFQGVNGCGKTHLAAAIVNYRFEARKPALFIVIPEFLDHLRKTFNPESKVSYDQLFEAVKNAPLLVLDDFGEQSTTPWAQEKLYQVLNYRYNARLATIITTSASLDEIEPRISSRMVDQKVGMVINITAPDYRGDQFLPNAGKITPRRIKKTRYGEG